MNRLTVIFAAGALLLVGCPSDANDLSPGNDFVPCGGDPTGNWSVESLTLQGDDALAGTFSEKPECAGVVRDLHVTPDGTYTFSGQNFTSSVDLTIDFDLQLTSTCLTALAASSTGAIQVNSALCSQLEQGLTSDPSAQIATASCGVMGDACLCSVSTGKTHVPAQGIYSVKGDQLSFNNAEAAAFCVQGDQLQLHSTDMAGMGEALLVLKRK